MRTLTIAIATYQRRDPVCTLVRGLAALLAADPALAESAWTCSSSSTAAPTAPSGARGARPAGAAARGRAGQRRARHHPGPLAGRWRTGEVIWFLDDDLAPLPETLRRHRESHESGPDHVCMGPCVLPDDADTAARRCAATTRTCGPSSSRPGGSTRYDRFSAANTSAPGGAAAGGRRLRHRVRRLRPRGLRARLPAGPGAAWRSCSTPGPPCCTTRSARSGSSCATRSGRGRTPCGWPGCTRTPSPDMIPASYDGRSYRLLGRLRVRSPRLLRAVSLLAAAAAPVEARLQGRDRLSQLAYAAAFASGVAREARGCRAGGAAVLRGRGPLRRGLRRLSRASAPAEPERRVGGPEPGTALGERRHRRLVDRRGPGHRADAPPSPRGRPSTGWPGRPTLGRVQPRRASTVSRTAANRAAEPGSSPRNSRRKRSDRGRCRAAGRPAVAAS